MKVVLATGRPSVNEKIENKFIEELEVVGKPLFREAVEPTIERTKADLVILSDVLEGVTEIEDMILKIRARHTHTRIIFIGKHMTPEIKAFLHRYMVLDILTERFNETELRNALFHPKQWEDVSNEDNILREFKREDFGTTKADLSAMKQIDKHEYAKIKPIVTGKNSLYQEYVAFWSVLDQSGKTFSAINTSLFLASNKDLKILLLDFNISNPNIHLQYGFTDADKNLGALIEDMEDGRNITPATLEKYLITHPVYENLKILPGYILKNAAKNDEFYIEVYNLILKAAQSSNFSTVLVDLEAGLRSDLNIHVLKTATRVLLHINETPGALYATRRMFDAEIGDFVPNLLSKKRVFPILNRCTDNYKGKFKNAVDAILDGNKTITFFNESNEIHENIFEGSPLMKQPTTEYYGKFFRIADTIHEGLFKPPRQRKAPESDSKKKPLGSIPIFKKKDK